MPAAAKQLHDRHLKRARALVKQKQYVAAIEQYAAALEAVPGDAVALTEMGWAAFLGDDLETADSTTRAAVDACGDDRRVCAGAHHNLGRILEKKGDRAGAVRAGQESLRLHDDPAVRRWLAELQAQAPPKK